MKSSTETLEIGRVDWLERVKASALNWTIYAVHGDPMGMSPDMVKFEVISSYGFFGTARLLETVIVSDWRQLPRGEDDEPIRDMAIELMKKHGMRCAEFREIFRNDTGR